METPYEIPNLENQKNDMGTCTASQNRELVFKKG